MGTVATVVVYLDELDTIKADPDFGKKFADAVLSQSIKPSSAPVNIPVFDGCHSSFAGQVIESHPSDRTVTVKISDHTGEVVRPKRP